MVIRMTELISVSAVIEAVGGLGAAKALTGKRTPQVVANWQRRGRLPPDTYLVFQKELSSRGFTAPPELWGIASALPTDRNATQLDT